MKPTQIRADQMDKRAMNGVIFPVAKILDENTIYCQKWVSVSEINRTFTDVMIVCHCGGWGVCRVKANLSIPTLSGLCILTASLWTARYHLSAWNKADCLFWSWYKNSIYINSLRKHVSFPFLLLLFVCLLLWLFWKILIL